MAKITIKSTIPSNLNWSDAFKGGSYLNITTQTASTFAFAVTVDGVDYVVTANSASANFAYATNPYYNATSVPLSGTISSIAVTADGNAAVTITGLAFELARFFRLSFDQADPFQGNTNNGDGWNVASALFSDNDTFVLEAGANANAIKGRNHGNDKIDGNALSNFFEADRGDDTYNGKGGYDELNYAWPTVNGDGFRGIVLDADAGTATDVFGDHDKFKNIENFQASMFADVLKGANQTDFDEWFYGVDGRDTIDGRGGFDWASYQQDYVFGGMRGINADLSKVDKKGFASIRDGFGDVDKIKNIEAIMGTNFADTMKGSKGVNVFQGLGGNDTLNGGKGSDWIVFWKNNDYIDSGYTGGDGKVIIDLVAGTVTDGLGGTDTISLIENASGSKFDDTMTGNGAKNEFEGQGGDDTLSGGANDDRLEGQDGDDTLDGGTGDDELSGGDGNDTMTGGADADTFVFHEAPDATTNHDIVADFSAVEGDRIALNFGAFSELADNNDTVNGSEYTQNSGGNATAASHRIILDTDNGKLYYDADGNAGGAKILVADLTGVTSLTTANFVIWF